MKIPRGARLLFIGDSITDCGRDSSGNPTPWNPQAGLGRGYVDLVAAHLAVVHPDRKIRVINRGVSGNTVHDLAARWQTDVLEIQPDWLCVMIGINDVWRQFDQPMVTEAHVLPEAFEQTLGELVNTVPVNGLIMMTPFVIEPNRSEPMRHRMDEYGRIVQRIATARNALFVDAQAAFDEILAHHHPMTLAWDRIHPGTVGHLVLARAFLRAVGASGIN